MEIFVLPALLQAGKYAPFLLSVRYAARVLRRNLTILQWAIYRVLNPLYEKTYIKDSYACIKDRGREKAAARLQYWLRQVDRKPEQYYLYKLFKLLSSSTEKRIISFRSLLPFRASK